MSVPKTGFVAGWQRFWFAPQSTSTVEIFRIVLGLLTVAWMLAWLPVFDTFYGASPAIPEIATQRLGAWTFFSLVGGSPLAWGVLLMGIAAAVALTVGYRTRLAAVVVFAVMLSMQREAPWILNAGDGLLRTLAFYLVLMPAGSALSVDRWREDREGFWSFPERAPWALRLAQIQLSVIYISTVWEKVETGPWRSGTAVSYALRVGGIERFATPSFLTDSLPLMQLATWGTLAVELSLGILVWNRAARPWVLAMGVLLHVSIDLTMTIGFFSLGMLTLYLVFLSPSVAERIVGKVRARAARRRRRIPPHREHDSVSVADVVPEPRCADSDQREPDAAGAGYEAIDEHLSRREETDAVRCIVSSKS